MLTAPAADMAPGRFRAFGGVLQSARPLPGLPVAAAADDGQFPFWCLVTHESDVAPAHTPDARIAGRLTYSSGPVVTLSEHRATAEVVISDTGRFTIDAEARIISHLAPVGVDRAAVALDLIGVVLPYAMHREGAWCMHASAVQTPEGAVAFVATRGTGKSTLAAACVQAGCALVADDVVVLREQAGAVTVTPSGVPLRLRAETARRVGVYADDADGWGKVRVAGPLLDAVLPLAAVYLLSAASPDDSVERVERGTRAAALALFTNGKITELLGGVAAGEALGRCVTLAGMAPVYDIAVPRDLARLPDVVQALLRWHAAPRPGSPSA
jgi:hypothetical protein